MDGAQKGGLDWGMLVKLKSGYGLLNIDSVPFGTAIVEPVLSAEPPLADPLRWIERPALICYVGDFESADGPVEVTEAKLALLVARHNERYDQFMAEAGGVDLKFCPPVQKDHSVLADDTIGRVVGKLELGMYTPMDTGKEVMAVYGVLRFIGHENCLKVEGKLWTHLSIGANFAEGVLTEVTVTPFPAALDASLLSAVQKRGATMDVTKMKAFLTGIKKMSESEADQHLAKCQADETEMSRLSAEVDEHDKKLSAEKTEQEEKEKKETEAKMSAARAKITTLSAGFKTRTDTVRLAAKKTRIITRLSRLRAGAKITPAEVKKIDIAKLAAEPDSAVELVLKTYEDREPVIHTGQLGSVKATDVSAHHGAVKLTRLEAETRANMPLLRAKDQNEAKLRGVAGDDRQAPSVTTIVEEAHVDPALLEKECGELDALIDGGKSAEAKVKLRGFMRRVILSTGAVEGLEAHATDTETQLSALMAEITKMETDYSDIVKLAGSLAGVQTA